MITGTLGSWYSVPVEPGVDRPGSGEDRPFECGSCGCEGGVLLPVVVWCRM